MNFNLLIYFAAVCQYGTVTEAARQLHISQPSLTSSIRQLESEYQVNLFHRVGRHLTLTREGEQLLVWAQEILKKVSDTENALRDLASKKNRILLGVPPMIGSFLFPRIFAGFHEEYPEIDLEIQEQSSREIYRLLAEEQLELAIALLNDVDSTIFKCRKLYTTELCCCVSRNHPLANASSVDMKLMERERVVLLRGSQYHVECVMKRYDEAGVRPLVVLRSAQLATIKRLVETGQVISFLFREAVDPREQISVLPLDPPLLLDVGTVYKRGHYLYNDVSKLLDYINRMYQ